MSPFRNCVILTISRSITLVVHMYKDERRFCMFGFTCNWKVMSFWYKFTRQKSTIGNTWRHNTDSTIRPFSINLRKYINANVKYLIRLHTIYSCQKIISKILKYARLEVDIISYISLGKTLKNCIYVKHIKCLFNSFSTYC